MAALATQSSRPSNLEALRQLTYRGTVPVAVNPFADIVRSQPVAVLAFDHELRVTGAYGLDLDRYGLSSRDERRFVEAVFDGSAEIAEMAKRTMVDGIVGVTTATVRGRRVRCRMGQSRCTGGLTAGLIWVEEAR